MKSTKKWLSLLLALALVLALLPQAVLAADSSGKCGDNLTWTFKESTGELTISGTGEMWNWASSKTAWDDLSRQIKTITIESGVTSIGGHAFMNCYNLTSAVIPSSVKTIGDYAFQNCDSLNRVTISEGLVSVGMYAFTGCKELKSVLIPASVTEIKSHAFGFYRDTTQQGAHVFETNFPVEGFTVYGAAGSAAEKYARENSLAFIEPKYDLTVGGKAVTYGNRSDILGNGVFSFDGEQTLTVSGSYSSENDIIVNEGIRGLRIVVEKDSALTSTARNAIRIKADTTITGGRLTLNAPSSNSCGIYVYADRDTTSTVTLTLQNADLVVRGDAGISGPLSEHTSKTSLVVDSSEVHIAAKEDGAVCDFGGGITITGCEIKAPLDAKLTADGKCIADASGAAAKEVRISTETIPFLDVSREQYFYAPVTWAVQHDPQITNGTDPTHFSPDKTCTRAQVVTFLWRAKGCPEPVSSENPFVDVREGQYYYKAVLWAVENGVTNGVDRTHFGPDRGCTRGQVVTFLWRAEGQPDPLSEENPFIDVPENQYYYTAVLWAVGSRITTGTSPDRFSPDATCTRGQIVTFLYRDIALVNKLLEDDFLMYIEDVFSIIGRGVVLTGRVENGVLHPGDQLRVYTYGKDSRVPMMIDVTCKSIEMSHKTLDEAQAGDNISILIGSSDMSLFRRGDAVAGRSVPIRQTVVAVIGDLHLFTKEEGGLHTPITDNFRPQVYIGTSDVAAFIGNLPDGILLPGSTAYDVWIGGFPVPVVVYPGQKLTIRDSGRTRGEFTVKEIQP